MRQRLHENARLAHDGFRALGFPFADTPIPILNLAGSPEIDLERVFFALDREDIVVAYVPPHGYSDAPDVESLRIAIFSDHTKDQITRLVDGVRRAL